MSFINKTTKIAADNIRVERTGKITLDADGLYYIFKLPKKAFVHAVHLEILTATDDPDVGDVGTLELGFAGNAETADSDYFAATDATLPLVAGMKSFTKGKWFVDAGGAITATWAAEDSATDPVIRAFVTFTVIH